jgi:hypothetical protein
MKGHVGDGVWSGGFKAPGASLNYAVTKACPDVTIRLTSAGIGSLNSFVIGLRGFTPVLMMDVTQT